MRENMRGCGGSPASDLGSEAPTVAPALAWNKATLGSLTCVHGGKGLLSPAPCLISNICFT